MFTTISLSQMLELTSFYHKEFPFFIHFHVGNVGSIFVKERINKVNEKIVEIEILGQSKYSNMPTSGNKNWKWQRRTRINEGSEDKRTCV